MERTKLYKLIIATLVVINVGILVFFLVGKPPHHGPPKVGDLAMKLELKGENKAKVTALEKDHHKLKRALVDKDRNLHNELFTKLGTSEDVSELQKEIVENFVKTEEMTFSFFNKVSQYCSKDQKEQLKEMIHRAFQYIRGPRDKKR